MVNGDKDVLQKAETFSESSSELQANEFQEIVMRELSEDSTAELPLFSDEFEGEELTEISEVAVTKIERSSYWRTCFICGLKVPGNCEISFHKFPSDLIICTFWKQVCNLTAIDDISTLKICSRHFKQEDYVHWYTGAKNRKLKPGTVPSIGVPNPLFPPCNLSKDVLTNSLNNNEKNNISVSVLGKLSCEHPIPSSSGSSIDSVKKRNEYSSPESVPKAIWSKTPPVTVSLTDTENTSVHSTVLYTNIESDIPSPKSNPGTMTSVTISKNKDVSSPQNSPRTKKRSLVVRQQSDFKEGEPRVVLERLSSSDLNKYLRREENNMAFSVHGIVREEIVESHPEEDVPQSNAVDGNFKRILDAGDSNLKANANVCLLCNHAMDETVSLHRFPTRQIVRREWMRVCGLTKDEDVFYYKICSQHFRSEDFVVTFSKSYGSRKILYRDAVPSVNVRHPLKGVMVTKPGVGNSNSKEGNGVCCICNHGEDQSVSLFWFPALSSLRRQWMKACGMQEQHNVFNLKICSQHFRSEDFIKYLVKPLPGRLKLKVNAVPSLKLRPPVNEPVDSLADVRIENVSSISKDSNLWDASNLLEVIVNESSQPMYFDSEDLRSEGINKKVQRTCFLCSAKGRGRIFSPKSLHKFPEKEDTRNLWKQVCNIYDHDYMNTSSLLICSNHFSEDDYVVGTKLPGHTPVLKPDAVPWIDIPCQDCLEVPNPLSTGTKSSKRPDSLSSSENTVVMIDTEITVKEESLLPSGEEVKNKNTDSGSLPSSQNLSPPEILPFLRVKNVSQLLSKNVNASIESVPNSEVSTRNPEISEKNSDLGRVGTSVNVPIPGTLFVPEPVTLTQPVSHPSNLPVITSVYQAATFPATSQVASVAPNTASLSGSKPSTHFLYLPANINLSQALSSSKNAFIFPKFKLQTKPTDQSSALKIQGPVTQTEIPNTQNITQPINVGKCYNIGSKIGFIRPAQPLQQPQTLQLLQPRPPLPQSEKVSNKYTETVPPRNLPVSSSSSQIRNNYIVGNSSNTIVASSSVKVIHKLKKPEIIGEKPEDPTLPPAVKRSRLSEGISQGISQGISPNSSLSFTEPSLKTYQTENVHSTQLTQEQIKRIKNYVRSFDDLLIHLQKRDMLSKDAADILTNMVTNKSRCAIVKKLNMAEAKWTDDLRSFALTLHLMSGDAYCYLNRVWPGVFVPDVSVVRYWSKVKGGKPGFCSEILDAIFLTKNALCNVSISEMSLRQEILFENNRFYGGVDFGSDKDMQNDNMVPAQNALIFFVNSLVSSWRVPIGYFLIKSLDAKERANLLVRCLELLNEVGAVVLSVTIDGSLINASMCSHLGANFSYGVNFQPWILHPVTREKIFIIWDPCCMIKLVRDTLGDKGTLIDYKHTLIKWSFFKELAKVQSGNLWNIDTKLTNTHVNYQKNRDDLKLCLQTFSRSVYKEFMAMIARKLPEFNGADNTAMFCLMFNDVFDMLNCKSRFTRRLFQHPICAIVFASLRQSASACIEYIRGVTDECGTGVLKTPRKTGFLGLIICLTNIFEVYISGKKFGLTYLFTNKLSLDYARTFSCAMQGNKQRLLNAKEFEERFKNLFLERRDMYEKTDILIDGIQILKVLSQKTHYKDPLCNYQIEKLDELNVYDYFKAIPSFGLSGEDEIKYISGFVVGKILKRIVCSVCASQLTSLQETRLLTLGTCKRPKEYYVPSEDVCRICKTAERMLRENKNLKLKPSNVNFFVIKTFSRVFRTVFNTKEMNSHTMEQDSLDNHRTQLCKLVAETFFIMQIIHERR